MRRRPRPSLKRKPRPLQKPLRPSAKRMPKRLKLSANQMPRSRPRNRLCKLPNEKSNNCERAYSSSLIGSCPLTDTPRGLVVNMGDVLFDTGKSDLRSNAREALSKLTGIVLNYPSLKLNIEGHTDSTGSAELNQTLSEERANSVRDYLIGQGLDARSLSALGFGMNNPVADNSTGEGRQKNRRVEIIVSGEVIGEKVGT